MSFVYGSINILSRKTLYICKLYSKSLLLFIKWEMSQVFSIFCLQRDTWLISDIEISQSFKLGWHWQMHCKTKSAKMKVKQNFDLKECWKINDISLSSWNQKVKSYLEQYALSKNKSMQLHLLQKQYWNVLQVTGHIA